MNPFLKEFYNGEAKRLKTCALFYSEGDGPQKISEKIKMENKLSKNEQALAKYGQLVETVDGLKAGDIIGINYYRVAGNKSEMYQEAIIHFVDRVEEEIELKKNETIPPTAYFKRPNIGIRFSDSLEVDYAYIHVPSAASNCRTEWYLIPKNTIIRQNGDLEMTRLEEDQNSNPYLIKQGLLYELGQLIPPLELPSFGFMFQSNNPQETKDICVVIKKEFENARKVYSEIKQIFKQHQSKANDRMMKERK